MFFNFRLDDWILLKNKEGIEGQRMARIYNFQEIKQLRDRKDFCSIYWLQKGREILWQAFLRIAQIWQLKEESKLEKNDRQAS